MHLGLTFGGLDTAIQAMHDHLRRSVFLPQPRGHGGWVESGIGPEQEITPERVLYEIDTASLLGAEIFLSMPRGMLPPRATGGAPLAIGRWTANASRTA
jgi:hypothetical protein